MKFFRILLSILINCTIPQAQNIDKPSLTILNIDAQNIAYDAVQMGDLVRLELDKLDTFEVMDKYDVAYLVKKNDLEIENCYGKICLLEDWISIECRQDADGKRGSVWRDYHCHFALH